MERNLEPRRALIAALMDEFWEREPRRIVTRDLRIPALPGKVDALIGMRRSGKTYRLYQAIQSLVERGVERSSILFLNFEDDRLLPLDRRGLVATLEGFYALHPENHDRECHLFLDEIQNVEGWPSVVRRFLDTRRVHITITGSSAKLLSREIATSLRGRSIATEVWPLSLAEYRRALELPTPSASPRGRDRSQDELSAYLFVGGLPEVTRIEELDRRRILQDYVSVVVLKDIVERHGVKNEALLRYFVKTLLSQIARPLSLNKLANDLKSQGRKTGKNTLYTYLDYIRDCYLAFDVPIFSESQRKRESNPRKIYAFDTGLARSQSFGLSQNVGRLFENLVFLDLKRAGCDVAYYLTKSGKEVDFIATFPDGSTRALQACATIEDPVTREREESALREAGDELNVAGEVVTLATYEEFVASLPSW